MYQWHLIQGITKGHTISRVSHGQTWSQCVHAQELYPHARLERNSPFPCSGQTSLPLLLFLCTSDLQHVYFSVRLFTELLRLLPTVSCVSNKNRNTSSKREICLYPCSQSGGGTRDRADGLRPHCPGTGADYEQGKREAGDRGRPWRSTKEKLSIECTSSM